MDALSRRLETSESTRSAGSGRYRYALEINTAGIILGSRQVERRSTAIATRKSSRHTSVIDTCFTIISAQANKDRSRDTESRVQELTRKNEEVRPSTSAVR